MNSNNWYWQPGIGLGVICFGDKIRELKKKCNLIKEQEEEDITGWITYKVASTEVFLEEENGYVVSISSYDNFFYKDVNLIGMNVDDIKQLFSSFECKIGESTEYEDGDIQTAYELDELGLQLWESEGCIVAAACYDTD